MLLSCLVPRCSDAPLSPRAISSSRASPQDLGLSKLGRISSSIAAGSQEAAPGKLKAKFRPGSVLVKADIEFIHIQGVGRIASAF